MSAPRPFPVSVSPPCHCGAPIPAGRTAYCSPRCRLADMDHGSDIEPIGEAA